MKTTDPASLQNLNDIVMPAATAWWPLASGWYFLSGLILIITAWFVYKALQRWKGNRYRRAALRELQVLARDMQSPAGRDSSLRQIPVLLKRAALSAYPRHEVASLSGQDWHAFLNSKVRHPSFSDTTLQHLDHISYSCGELTAIDSEAASALLDASTQWLKHHQPASRPKTGKGT